MTSVSTEQILESYGMRECDFTQDGASHTLGQTNKSGGQINRPNVHYRELGNLKLAASLDRVQYGLWKKEKACLLSLRFQFHSGSHKVFRFTKVDVSVRLQSRTSKNVEDYPDIRDCGPKRLKSLSTDSQEATHWSGEVSLKANLGTCELGPKLEGGRNSSYTRRYAQEVQCICMPDNGTGKACQMLLWARENERQGDGLPIEILTTLIFTYSSLSQATIKVTSNGLFNLLARPWTKDHPLLLDEKHSWGTPIRSQHDVDFSDLSEDEWVTLVTPDLEVKNRLHGR